MHACIKLFLDHWISDGSEQRMCASCCRRRLSCCGWVSRCLPMRASVSEWPNHARCWWSLVTVSPVVILEHTQHNTCPVTFRHLSPCDTNTILRYLTEQHGAEQPGLCQPQACSPVQWQEEVRQGFHHRPSAGNHNQQPRTMNQWQLKNFETWILIIVLSGEYRLWLGHIEVVGTTERVLRQGSWSRLWQNVVSIRLQRKVSCSTLKKGGGKTCKRWLKFFDNDVQYSEFWMKV